MLLGDQPDQFLLLSLRNAGWDADILLILLRLNILVLRFFVDNQKTGKLHRRTRRRATDIHARTILPVTSTCKVS